MRPFPLFGLQSKPGLLRDVCTLHRGALLDLFTNSRLFLTPFEFRLFLPLPLQTRLLDAAPFPLGRTRRALDTPLLVLGPLSFPFNPLTLDALEFGQGEEE